MTFADAGALFAHPANRSVAMAAANMTQEGISSFVLIVPPALRHLWNGGNNPVHWMLGATGTLYFLLKVHDAAIYLAVLSPLVRSGGPGRKMVLRTKNGITGN